MPKEYTAPECDVVVLSGDISPGLPGLEWALKSFTMPVIYILGNHEFQGMRMFHKHIDKMRNAAAGTNVHLLYNEAAVIDGVRFLGTTLWADLDLYGNKTACEPHVAAMHDYRAIRHDYNTPVTTGDLVYEHMNAKLWLTDELSKPFDGKTVVCTHHAPSEKSIHKFWKGHICTPAYASNLDGMITQFQPTLWTHGHVHNNFDYKIGKTRIVCNPRGFRGPKSHEHNADYNEKMVLKI